MIRAALPVVLLFFAPEGVSDLIRDTVDSGRAVAVGDSPSERVAPGRFIAPGAPPVLMFRYFDAADRGRVGNLGLMTDDAGH
jgi:hypothetical protein